MNWNGRVERGSAGNSPKINQNKIKRGWGEAELAAEFPGAEGGVYVLLPHCLPRRRRRKREDLSAGLRALLAAARRGGEERALVESASPQVVGDDDIRDGVEDELDVVGVGGAGDVRVDLLVGGLVLALVLSLDVSHCLGERVGACKRAERKGKKSRLKQSHSPTSAGGRSAAADTMSSTLCRNEGGSQGLWGSRCHHVQGTGPRDEHC